MYTYSSEFAYNNPCFRNRIINEELEASRCVPVATAPPLRAAAAAALCDDDDPAQGNAIYYGCHHLVFARKWTKYNYGIMLFWIQNETTAHCTYVVCTNVAVRAR